jgi:hypothetical protein
MGETRGLQMSGIRNPGVGMQESASLFCNS